ncbi:MAG: hypothetical protein ALECFALPRED_009479 [Alectoria fallacina]|uniref:Uncharacterized protein n=1 Tax=Alectoria fallacina TaxID=1903189 RepID=A0A8H3J7J2_9LECA|nr:MAG: hypothetical protein ALECFALPRED_009479 [Alectoria fallacina]
MVFRRLRRFLRRVFRRGQAPVEGPAPRPATMPESQRSQELVLRAGRAALQRRGELVPLGMEDEDNATARSEEAGEEGGEPHVDNDDNVTVIDEEEQVEEERGLR